jgi:hypothetical protein
MGLLDRAIGALNKAYAKVDVLDGPGDLRFRRPDALLAGGRQATGRITGIERRLADGSERTILAVAVDGGLRAGMHPVVAPIGRLRLGMPVLVRCDGRHAVLDWPAMCARWTLEPGSPSHRFEDAPEDGVSDRALDARVQKRLKRWTPGRGTLVGLERRLVLGMPSENWTAPVALGAGGEAATGADEVPCYARWLAAPGAQVPLAVDPGDPSRCVIDWAAAAVEHAVRAGGLDDPPPPGSVAEADEARR